MNSEEKQSIYFIAFCVLALIVSIMMMGCAHLKETELNESFYESGQIKDRQKKDAEKYGILFSEGKEFNLIEIN